MAQATPHTSSVRSSIAPSESNPATVQVFGALGEAVLDMLGSCGVSNVRRTSAVATRMDCTCLASFIGFTGAWIRGCLTVLGPSDVFARTHPGQAMGAILSESDVSDWCCEFSNQLLGRLKNKLLRRGVDIELSTPQGILAESLRLSAHGDGMLQVATYDVAPLELTTSIEVSIDEALTFSEGASEVGSAGEGDVMLL